MSMLRIERYAALLERDIERKGLLPGQPYLTGTEAARMLGVHIAMANRAMVLLVEKSLLVRKPGVGTFVGPQVASRAAVELKSVHVLGSLDRFGGGFPQQILLETLASAMPQHSVHLDILPRGNAVSHVKRGLEGKCDNRDIAGVVLLGCPAEIQSEVLNSGIPAVVFGGVYHETTALPSIDKDQYRMGRIEAEYLLKKGHRKIAYFCRETWLPGDNLRLDGLNDALSEAELNHGSLIIRSLRDDKATIESEARLLLSMPDRPTGLICCSPAFAEAVLASAESLGIHVPGDIDIVFNNTSRTRTSSAVSRLPQIWAEMDSVAQSQYVSSMLKKCIDGQMPEPEHVVLPVRLASEKSELLTIAERNTPNT
ncbi:MAG: substrate-binding domain-containing protein [Phycisphaerae bacterium]|nr:substrate-binding domain-containing protein [Phycisphaerae bacterium]